MNLIKQLTALPLLLLTLSSCDSSIPTGSYDIIPQPLKIEAASGYYKLSNDVTIGVTDSSLEAAASHLQTMLSKAFGNEISIAQSGAITLKIDESITEAEGYTLTITNDGITIAGGGYGGVLYGIESLRQMLPVISEVESGVSSMRVPFVDIADAPNYKWRGFMLDVSRHFYSVEEVKEVLDMMAFYKLNIFHWHLTDDQGWRIEIDKYPLLTEQGAWRKFNNHDQACMNLERSQDNIDYKIDTTKLKINGTDTLYGGYYTKQDIRDVIAYAKSLNIDILPEVDMPGHSLCAIDNYDGISCFKETGWGTTFTSPMCPGKDSALEFAKNVYKEVFELFPFEYVHLGADEVDKSNWIKCPDCQRRIRKHGLSDEKELQAWFVDYMEAYFNENGKKLIGWDEIHEGGVSESATVMWWRNWAPESLMEATAQGNHAISSPNSNLYFDMTQDRNSLRKVYDHEAALSGMTAKQKSLIFGVQANLWCEYVPSMARAEFMMFPRMIALSEAAWSAPEAKKWERFEGKLITHLERLDVLGINYRPLDLYGFYDTNTFTEPIDFVIGIPQKDIKVYYTTDGSTPTSESTPYTKPIRVDSTTHFKLRSYRPNGTAAEVVSTSVVIEDYMSSVDVDHEKLSYSLELAWHNFTGWSCKDIDKAELVSRMLTNYVAIPSGVRGNIGLVFKGYFSAPIDDVYTFKLTSDDGSMLYLNDVVVVDNDGGHSPIEVIGQKALAKGYHKFEVRYFDSNGGLLDLVVLNSSGQEIKIVYKH